MIIFSEKSGKINIKIIGRFGLCIIILFEIIYIFNYSRNLISTNKIKIKKIYWNSKHKKLIKNKKSFLTLKFMDIIIYLKTT